jgi:hypothetical protein
MDRELATLIANWLQRRSVSQCVQLRERVSPPHDAQDDYTVVYDAVLEPWSEDRLRMEIWLTDAGLVAVGIETRRRVARRLGIRTLRQGFAGGHEPQPVNASALRVLLDAVADGEISIRYTSLFGILLTTQTSMAEERFSLLQESGYEPLGWINREEKRTSALLPEVFGNTLKYIPWQRR